MVSVLVVGAQSPISFWGTSLEGTRVGVYALGVVGFRISWWQLYGHEEPKSESREGDFSAS